MDKLVETLREFVHLEDFTSEDGMLIAIGKPKGNLDELKEVLNSMGYELSFSEPIPDFHTWDEEIYVPEDINDIADNLWKLREDIWHWQFNIDVPQEVLDLLLLNDRRKIYFQLKDWGYDKRREVMRFIEWFESHYGALAFWEEAMEKLKANPFGKNYVFKVKRA